MTTPITTATLLRRMLAGSLDWLAVIAIAGSVMALLIATDPTPPEIPPWNLLDRIVDYIQARPGRTALGFLAFVICHIGWTFVWARSSGQGLGDRALRLRLVDRTGRPPGAGRLAGWLVARVAGTLLAGVGLWWAVVDVERRTLHDRVAGIWVERLLGD